MLNVTEILYKICNDENVYNLDFDLIESGLLDSLAFIELFSTLEDNGIFLNPTRIDRNLLRTPRSIQVLIDEYTNKKM